MSQRKKRKIPRLYYVFFCFFVLVGFFFAIFHYHGIYDPIRDCVMFQRFTTAMAA